MTKHQALLALLLILGMATAGAVWQFGPYGLYAGAAAGLLALTFIDIEKGGRDSG
jgi:hypothetical protein